MSAFGATSYGVDATDGILKAVKLVRRGRTIQLAGSWRIPYLRGDDEVRAVRAALRAFVSAARPDVLARVVVGTPDRGHVCRTYLVPNLAAGRLDEMVTYEVLNELGVPAEDALVRFHARKGVVEQQVHAVAFDPGSVETFVQGLREERIPFDELQPPGFALASFVEHEKPLGRDRILLGVGELSTELVLLREDGIWTRHVPLGMQSEDSPRALADRLAAEVASAVAFLLPESVSFQPVDLVLTEEGALSAKLTTELKRALKVPVTRFGELPRIDTGRQLESESATAAQTLSMGKAFGLALAGFDIGRFLCPVVTGNPRRAAARRLPLAALSLVFSAVGLFGLTHLALERADTLETTLSADLPGEMQDLLRRSSQTRAALGALQGRADGLLALARRRPAVLSVRTALQRVEAVVARRGSETLHVDSAWLAPGDTARSTLLTITLDADPSRDPTLAEQLPETFRGVFEEVAVSGPEPAPKEGLSRWIVEITLP